MRREECPAHGVVLRLPGVRHIRFPNELHGDIGVRAACGNVSRRPRYSRSGRIVRIIRLIIQAQRLRSLKYGAGIGARSRPVIERVIDRI